MADNKQLISKLQQVSELLGKNEELLDYYERGAAVETVQNIASMRKLRGTIEKTPSVFNTMPVFPLKKSTYEPLEKDTNDKKMLFFGVLGFAVIAFIIYYISHLEFMNTVTVIGIFAAAITGYLYFKTKNKYADKKKAYDDSVNLYNETMNTFRFGLSRYEQEKKKAMEELERFKMIQASIHDDYLKELDSYGDKKETAKKQYDENVIQIKSIDVIPENYYHLIDSIIDILRSGRADSYKEALNLAIDDERQEREAQERREAEARRQAEEQRRTEIMMRQAEEERRHNEQMEREQASYNAKMEQQAREDRRRQEKMAWEAKVQADKQRSEQMAAQNRARMAGVAKCASCANSRNCPSHIKNNGGGLNCGGYVPYGAKR